MARKPGVGKIQKKLLTLLLGGLSFSLSRSPRQQIYILKSIVRELKEIDRKSIDQAIASLYKSKLVSVKENVDGKITMLLTENGRIIAQTQNLDNINVIKPKYWDEKWRIVLSDIPEVHKKARDALRLHLKKMGFFEFQKSVWVYPYNCKKELEFIVEFYGIKKFVRYGILEKIDNDLHLRQNFDLA